MKNIIKYGWNKYIAHQNLNNEFNASEIGRIISVKGTLYILQTDKGTLETELTGKLLYSSSKEEYPKVGDWVQFIKYGSQGYIHLVLPRYNSLYRKSAGKETKKQVIAANIDVAIIVQGLDNDFNIMRLERYIVQIVSCKIKPVVILNKADLIEDQEKYEKEVKKLQRNIPVYFCSTFNNSETELLKNKLFKRENTYVLLGSSGVGKSSLLNAISGSDIRKINQISDATGKGKHTTTTRDLFVIPNGSLIIDTPGMREFGVGFSETSNDEEIFPIINVLGKNCKYRDCKHINEKGCAVIQALNDNSIDPVVYNSYVKLIKEQHYFEKSIQEKRREGKQFGKMARKAMIYRKKYKY